MALIVPDAWRQRSAGVWWASLHAEVSTRENRRADGRAWRMRDRLDLVDELQRRGVDDERLIAAAVAERVTLLTLRRVAGERLGWPLTDRVEAAEVVAGAVATTGPGEGLPDHGLVWQVDSLCRETRWKSGVLGELSFAMELEVWDERVDRKRRLLRSLAEEAGVVTQLHDFERRCPWPDDG